MRVVSPVPNVRASYPSVAQQTGRTEWRHWPKAVGLSVVAVLREWCRRSRERTQLASLDDRMLRDIGVTRGEVLSEINKPFWRR
jgi:uncharacterized protein YjiS (DUF1127 family)